MNRKVSKFIPLSSTLMTLSLHGSPQQGCSLVPERHAKYTHNMKTNGNGFIVGGRQRWAVTTSVMMIWPHWGAQYVSQRISPRLRDEIPGGSAVVGAIGVRMLVVAS